jgi:hypothetical protein
VLISGHSMMYFWSPVFMILEFYTFSVCICVCMYVLYILHVKWVPFHHGVVCLRLRMKEKASRYVG